MSFIDGNTFINPFGELINVPSVPQDQINQTVGGASAAAQNTLNAALGGTSVGSQEASLENMLVYLRDTIAQLENIKADVNSFNITQDESYYYTRKVKPLIDAIYFISFSARSIGEIAQISQANAYGKRKEVKETIDLVYDMTKEIECMFHTFQKRMRIFRCGIEEDVAHVEAQRSKANRCQVCGKSREKCKCRKNEEEYIQREDNICEKVKEDKDS